jgi:hypothetical protein
MKRILFPLPAGRLLYGAVKKILWQEYEDSGKVYATELPDSKVNH